MSSTSASLAPSEGGLQREQRDLQERLRRPASEPCREHGGACAGEHGHTHDAAEDEASALEREVAEGGLDDDPGLAQCCVQEVEDRRKHSELLKTLRRVDPIAGVEREMHRVVTLTEHVDSVQAWVRGLTTQTAHDHSHSHGGAAAAAAAAAEAGEEEEASDDELDAFMADFGDEDEEAPDAVRLRCEVEQRLEQQQRRFQALHDERALATLLASKACPRVLLLSAPSHAPLLARAEQELQALLDRWPGRFLAASFPRAALGANHPVSRAVAPLLSARAGGPGAAEPALVVLDAEMQAVQAFSRTDLERDWNCIRTAVERLCLRAEGPGASADADTDADAPKQQQQQQQQQRYCDKEGCTRTFEHEHIKPRKPTLLDALEDHLN